MLQLNCNVLYWRGASVTQTTLIDLNSNFVPLSVGYVNPDWINLQCMPARSHPQPVGCGPFVTAALVSSRRTRYIFLRQAEGFSVHAM